MAAILAALGPEEKAAAAVARLCSVDPGARDVAELAPEPERVLELPVGRVRVLGSERERAELVAGPGEPGRVPEGRCRAERDAERMHERDPAAREREQPGEDARERDRVVVAPLAVGAVERVQDRVGLAAQEVLVEDPPLRDRREELEPALDAARDALRRRDSLLRAGERAELGLRERVLELARVRRRARRKVRARPRR